MLRDPYCSLYYIKSTLTGYSFYFSLYNAFLENNTNIIHFTTSSAHHLPVI